MRLSSLQRFILRECYLCPKVRVPRALFSKYYSRQSTAKNENITVSVERLIDRGFLVGFGRRTPRKWFIEEVRLTNSGRHQAKASFGKQQHLPFH